MPPTACSNRKRNCSSSVFFGRTPYFLSTSKRRYILVWARGHLFRPLTESCDLSPRVPSEESVACHRPHYLLAAFVLNCFVPAQEASLAAVVANNVANEKGSTTITTAVRARRRIGNRDGFGMFATRHLHRTAGDHLEARLPQSARGNTPQASRSRLLCCLWVQPSDVPKL